MDHLSKVQKQRLSYRHCLNRCRSATNVLSHTMTSTINRTNTKELPGSIYLPLNFPLHNKSIDAIHIQSPRVQRSRIDIEKWLKKQNTDPLAVSTEEWDNRTTIGIN